MGGARLQQFSFNYNPVTSEQLKLSWVGLQGRSRPSVTTASGRSAQQRRAWWQVWRRERGSGWRSINRYGGTTGAGGGVVVLMLMLMLMPVVLVLVLVPRRVASLASRARRFDCLLDSVRVRVRVCAERRA